MSFEAELRQRSAETYADFLVPHIEGDARVLDCGCGSGSISVGLGKAARHGAIIGVDLTAAQLLPAACHVRDHSIENVHFVAASAASLPFPASCFDAALCHSVLEVLADPLAVLREVWRVLSARGALAAASVEYGGLVVSGPESERLRRFYAVRERLWELESRARPRAGRELRKLLHEAGFIDVHATAHYLSYGSQNAVQAFGEARAADCREQWFTSRSLRHGLLSRDDLKRTEAAWLAWAESPDAFAAFAWCRATGRKPAS